MLAMWKRETFPFTMSGKCSVKEKLNFVELFGVDLTVEKQAPVALKRNLINHKTNRISVLEKRFVIGEFLMKKCVYLRLIQAQIFLLLIINLLV